MEDLFTTAYILFMRIVSVVLRMFVFVCLPHPRQNQCLFQEIQHLGSLKYKTIQSVKLISY